MSDVALPILAAACFVVAAASFLNIWHARTVRRHAEQHAYDSDYNVTDIELWAMPMDQLLDLRSRLDSSVAAAERLDAIILTKDANRRHALAVLSAPLALLS